MKSYELDKMDSLVTTVWLNQHLEDPDLVVLDCTVNTIQDDKVGIKNLSGKEDYEIAHIPSAGFADFFGDISDNDSPYEFALPTPEQFCAAMGNLGANVSSDQAADLARQILTAMDRTAVPHNLIFFCKALSGMGTNLPADEAHALAQQIVGRMDEKKFVDAWSVLDSTLANLGANLSDAQIAVLAERTIHHDAGKAAAHRCLADSR